MLTEQVILGTQRSSLDNSSVSTAESSIAVFDLHTYSQTASFKRSSTLKNCLAVTPSHIFAAQGDKAVINIYNRSKQNLESTVPFQEKFTVIEASGGSGAFLAGGTDSGRLTIWEVCVILRTSNGLPKSLFRKVYNTLPSRLQPDDLSRPLKYIFKKLHASPSTLIQILS